MAQFEYTEEDLTNFLRIAVQLVEVAGQRVREAIDDRAKVISEKLSPTDLVTETDKAVEKLLVDGLR